MKYLQQAVASLMPDLIIEEVYSHAKVAPQKLKKSKVLDGERLVNVSHIHIIKASPAQLYCANRLKSYPHMRLVQDEEKEYLAFAKAHGFSVDTKKNIKNKSIRYYNPNESYLLGDIVRVVNLNTPEWKDIVLPFLDESYLFDTMINIDSQMPPAPDILRGNYLIPHGFTSQNSCNRDAIKGMNTPCLTKSIDGQVDVDGNPLRYRLVKAIIALSKMVKKALSDKDICNDQNRNQLFAHALASGVPNIDPKENIMEHSALFTAFSVLLHMDIMNSDDEKYSWSYALMYLDNVLPGDNTVKGLAVSDDLNNVVFRGIFGYHRHCCSTTLRRKGIYTKLYNHLVNYLDENPDKVGLKIAFLQQANKEGKPIPYH